MTDNSCGKKIADFFSLKRFRFLLAAIASNFNSAQINKCYAPRATLVGTVILSALWIALSLFALPCTGAEAAVPKPEEISGEYHYNVGSDNGFSVYNPSGTLRMVFQGNSLYMIVTGEEPAAASSYNAQAGTAHWTFKDDGGTTTTSLRFSKGADGKVHASGTHTYINPKGKKYVCSVNITQARSLGGASADKDSKVKKNSDKNDSAKKADGKQTAKKADEESGGLGTVGTVGIGLAAAGAIGFGVTHLGGGAGAGGGSGAAGAAEAETPPAPPEPESFVFTDPATGAQSLYEKDPETGEWVNPETGGIVDIGDLDRFANQRQADADWTRGQAEKLSNRDTDLDRAWREQDAKTDAELQRKFEEIDRQGARDRVAIKSGTYGMSEEERTKYLTDRQERLQKNSEAANQSAKNWDRITKTAEVVEKAADIAVDGLSVATGPAGQLVANVYSGAKNIAGSTSEAIAKGESIVGGITKGVAKGGADIAQNLAGGKWVKKLATYAGSETLKEVVVAAVDGENVLKAAGKGLVNGTFKYAVSEIGDNISAGYGKQNENLMKQHYKEIKNVWSKSKDLSQKSVNALQSMNFQKYFGKETTRELAQGFGQSITKEIGATTYDMGVEGKSVTESLFDDKW